MATTRHDDNDGSDIFWPGYVDATTNLILNLLFLLTILIVAVFMFALELGRMSKVASDQPNQEDAQIVSKVVAVGAIQEEEPSREEVDAAVIGTTGAAQLADNMQETEPVEKNLDPVEENLALKREIERLNSLLAEQADRNEHAGGIEETVEASSIVPKPEHGLDKTMISNAEVVVNFKDEAIALTQDEENQLLKTLQPIVASGQAKIFVEVPAGFSEAKRLGFYRAMAIRNLLIEMKLPNENIDVLVTEGKSQADASRVRVRTR